MSLQNCEGEKLSLFSKRVPMPVQKSQMRRLVRIVALLKENRYPNYPRFLAEMKRQDLAGAYELSARTLQRDIACLKSEYGA